MNKKTTQSPQKNTLVKAEPVKSCKRNVVSILLKHAKHRAKKRNLEFNLTKDDIVIPEVCPVLGIEIRPFDFHHSPSIDRIDNTRGYTKDNIIVVSFKANQYKGAANIKDLRKVVEFYENLNHKTSSK